MDDKDIIIKLLEKADDTSEAQSMHEFYGHIADYLLANGVAVVKHGRWIYHSAMPQHIIAECSECRFGAYLRKYINDPDGKKAFDDYCKGTRYCQSCGAKMNGGNEDANER